MPQLYKVGAQIRNVAPMNIILGKHLVRKLLMDFQILRQKKYVTDRMTITKDYCQKRRAHHTSSVAYKNHHIKMGLVIFG